MKFSTYLEQIAGVSIYPVVSLALFAVFFSAVLYLTFSMNKDEVRHIENLPLNDKHQ